MSHPAILPHEALPLSERLAKRVVNGMGSWKFVFWQAVLMLVWGAINLCAIHWRWDPYPFVLLNLVLSTQAAFAAPLILIGAKRSDQTMLDLANHDHSMLTELLSIVKGNS